MKISTLKFCLTLLLCATFASQLPGQFLAWDYENIFDDITGGGQNPDMARDNAGNLHITFWSQAEDRLVYCQRPLGSQQLIFEFVDTLHSNGFLSSVTTDSQNRPHVAFYENDQGSCQLRYAVRTAPGTWVVDTVPSKAGRGYGSYNDFTLKHTLDLVLDAQEDPQIIAFNGYTGPMIEDCFISDDEWQSYQAYRLPSGTWKAKRLSYISGVSNGCSGDTLPDGDRYGEYSTTFLDANGNVNVVLMGKTQLKTFRLVQGANDSSWTTTVIDSVYRQHEDELVFNQPCGWPCWTWIPNFLNPEGFASTVSPDGSIHLSYTTSLNWGDNFCCKRFSLLLYTRIDTSGAITYYDFDPVHSESQHYRSHTSMANQGNDSLFISYVDRDTGMIMMNYTYDRGMTWATDTLFQTSYSAYAPIEIVNDSIYVLAYVEQQDRLILARKALNATSANWDYLPINSAQSRGASLEAEYVRGSSDTMFFAYNDGFDRKLYFSHGQLSGSTWSFLHEELDTSGTGGFKAVSYARSSAGVDNVLYSAGQDGSLRMASNFGGTWAYETIDTSNQTTFTTLEISANDTIHLAYFDGTSLQLKYLKRHLSGGSWQSEIVDTLTPPVGSFPDLELDANGNPHLVYYDGNNFSLRYAYKMTAGSGWQYEYVDTFGFSISGMHNVIKIAPNSGEPAVVYLDQGTNRMKFAERAAGGSWAISVIDSGGSTSLGRPSDLEFDQFGNPWIAYNYFASYDRIRLAHRDTTWRQVGVSSQGRLANSFDLGILDGDLFLLGKKSAANNPGMGVLFAPNGVFVNNEELVTGGSPEFKVWPNPFREQLNLQINNPDREKVSVQIFNAMGQVIYKKDLEPGQTDALHNWSISTHNFPSGIVFVACRVGENRTVKKLIHTR